MAKELDTTIKKDGKEYPEGTPLSELDKDLQEYAIAQDAVREIVDPEEKAEAEAELAEAQAVVDELSRPKSAEERAMFNTPNLEEPEIPFDPENPDWPSGRTVDEEGNFVTPGAEADADANADEEEPEDDRPGGNASTDDWYAWRLANGYTEEELEGLGRDALKDLADK